MSKKLSINAKAPKCRRRRRKGSKAQATAPKASQVERIISLLEVLVAKL